MPQNNIEIPVDHIAAFCERNHILKLSLFGSVLRDDFHAGSDIDVLVEDEPHSRIHYGDKGRMREELTGLLQRDVDLRTARELSPCFRDCVLADGLHH